MNHTSKEALWVLGYLFLVHGKADKARAVFHALTELFPDEPLFLKSLSYVHLQAGEYRDALMRAEAFLARDSRPEQAAVGALLKCRAYWGLGRHEEAREAMEDYMAMQEAQK